MLRLILCVLVAAAALKLVACDERKPQWIDLPTTDDLPYRVSFRTYEDGAYADQPFDLRVDFKDGSMDYTRALHASQCQNVQVGQTPDRRYVFYDHLALSGFLSGIDDRLPRPFLCDLDHEFCRTKLKVLVEAKQVVTTVCTFTQPKLHDAMESGPAATDAGAASGR